MLKILNICSTQDTYTNYVSCVSEHTDTLHTEILQDLFTIG